MIPDIPVNPNPQHEGQGVEGGALHAEEPKKGEEKKESPAQQLNRAAPSHRPLLPPPREGKINGRKSDGETRTISHLAIRVAAAMVVATCSPSASHPEAKTRNHFLSRHYFCCRCCYEVK